MVCACIDIGSNTTRLLVARAGPDGLVTLAQERSFTAIGRARGVDGTIGQAKIAEVVAVVAAQAAVARDLGAATARVVATAAVREAPDCGRLAEELRRETGLELAVLSGLEEARLAFAGATVGLEGAEAQATIAVVDVGGGSTELAVGTLSGGVSWCISLALGSSALTEAHLGGYQPPAEGLAEMRTVATSTLAAIDPPAAGRALAVGGSATSLRRLAGDRLDARALARAQALLAGSGVDQIAAAHELDPRRVRLLPAGLAILEAVSRRLGLALEISAGGLREGVLLADHLPFDDGARTHDRGI